MFLYDGSLTSQGDKNGSECKFHCESLWPTDSLLELVLGENPLPDNAKGNVVLNGVTEENGNRKDETAILVHRLGG